MYQHSYAEVLEDDQQEGRRIEAEALDTVVTMLMRASRLPAPSIDGVRALHLTRELWMILMRELARDDNALPETLRASLISIGIWILKEADAIRLGTSTNYAGIADICAIVRDGLR